MEVCVGYVYVSVNPGPYLDPNHVLSSIVKQLHDRRQLIKVEAVTQSYLRAFSASTGGSLIKQMVTRGWQLAQSYMWIFPLSAVELLPLLLFANFSLTNLLISFGNSVNICFI